MANSFTKGYADASALTEAELDAGFGTVQPTQANLALATTGSSANDLLTSIGSNLTPSWTSPNTVASTITAAGANAILGVVTSCQASVANLIGVAMTASGANAIIAVANSQSVPTAVLANNILDVISSCSSTSANLIADAVVRTTGSTVSHLGVGVSAVFSYGNTTTAYTDAISVDITTNGRPVEIALSPGGASATAYIQVFNNASTASTAGTFRLLRGTSTVGTQQLAMDPQGGVSSKTLSLPTGSLYFIDVISAGSYTYKLQGLGNAPTDTVQIINAKMITCEK